MQFAIELLGIAALSVATLLVTRLVLPEALGRRYPAALALGFALLVGFPLLIWGAPSAPEFNLPWLPGWRHWHWLPYLGAAAMLLGPLALAEGVLTVERLLLHGVLAFVAAALVVPTWSTLEPSRQVWIGILSGYLFVLIALLDPLAARLPGRLLVPLLAGVSAGVAVLVAAFVSITYGQIAGVAAAALVGGSLAARFETAATLVRGLLPAFVVLVGGCAFVGCIEPEPPIIALLLAPAAPLALWSCAVGPLSRLHGWRATGAQIGTVLVPLAAAALLAWLGEGTAARGY